MDFWKDPVVLAEGNVRGIPGGDPDFPSGRHVPGGGHIAGSSYLDPRDVPHIPDLSTLSGDLNAHAERLGIDVADIIAARHRTGSSGGSSLLDLIKSARERFTR